MLLIELVMDVLTLAVAFRFAGKRPHPERILLGALIGTLASAAVRAIGLPRAWQTALFLPIAGLMMLAAGGDRRRPIRGALLTVSAAGLLGGLILALAGALGSLPMAYALAVACALVSAAYAAHTRRAVREKASVVIRFRGRQAVFPALVDTGNSLRDYLTHRSVIVLPESEARKRLALPDAALRPIFAQTAGGRQMMGCLTPERTLVIIGGDKKRVNAVVALSPGLPPDAPALVPDTLLTDCREE